MHGNKCWIGVIYCEKCSVLFRAVFQRIVKIDVKLEEEKD